MSKSIIYTKGLYHNYFLIDALNKQIKMNLKLLSLKWFIKSSYISDGLSSMAPSSELELRNDKNLTQDRTQTSRRNKKGPTF